MKTANVDPTLHALATSADERIAAQFDETRHRFTHTGVVIHDASVPGLWADFRVNFGEGRQAFLGGTDLTYRHSYSVLAQDDAARWRGFWSEGGVDDLPSDKMVVAMGGRIGNFHLNPDAQAAMLARYERMAALPKPLAKIALSTFEPLVKANRKQPTERVDARSPRDLSITRNVRKLFGYALEHPEATRTTTRDIMYKELSDGRWAKVTRVTKTTPESGTDTHSTELEIQIEHPHYKRQLFRTYAHVTGGDNENLEVSASGAGLSHEDPQEDVIEHVTSAVLAGKAMSRRKLLR